MDPNRREIFMNIPAARVRSQSEQSFEELRAADYIKSYTTAGRAPQACPPLPLHPADRAHLGLPPHFQPYIEVGGQPSSEDPLAASLQLHNPSVLGPPPQDLNSLPDVQIFDPPADNSDPGPSVTIQNIVAQPTYSFFSTEELRYQAYRTGKITVPEVTNIPASLPTLVITPPSSIASNDQCQSITCTPAFEKHSFEELHLAYRRAGRELTSEQIIQLRIV